MGRPRNPVQRRYVFRVAIAMAAYLVTLSAAVRFVGHGGVTGMPAYLLALLPGLSVAGVFWAVGRLLVEERTNICRCCWCARSWSRPASPSRSPPSGASSRTSRLVAHVDAFYIAILWFFGLGLGSVYNWLTLRGEGERA